MDDGKATKALCDAAWALIAEIRKRDSEGNVLPDHLYAPLLRAVTKAEARS